MPKTIMRMKLYERKFDYLKQIGWRWGYDAGRDSIILIKRKRRIYVPVEFFSKKTYFKTFRNILDKLINRTWTKTKH